MANSIVAGVYDTEADRESAYEMLQNKVAERQQQAVQAQQDKIASQRTRSFSQTTSQRSRVH